MRGRPGSGILLLGEAGLRLAAVWLLGSLLLVVSLRAEGLSGSELLSGWLWALVRGGLGPDLAPGTVHSGLSAAPLGLTFLGLVVGFRLGQRLGPPGWAALAALPTALGGIALALLTGSLAGIPAALLAAVPGALALTAGSEWWRRRGMGAGRSSAVLRAAMAAAIGIAAGLLLAGVIAGVIRVLAAGGFLKMPTALVVALGFWPAAASAATFGPPAAGLLLGVIGPSLFLSTRSRQERLLFAALTGTGLSVIALAAAGGWSQALSAAGIGWAVALVSAAAGPLLGNSAFGHRVAALPPLRAFGDRLPPPAASELTSERMRPSAAEPVVSAGRPVRRTTPAGFAVSIVSALVAILCVVSVLAVTLSESSAPPEPAHAAAARAYLAALASNDAARIWPLVVVDDGAALPAGDHLLARDDLARMLAVAGNRHQRVSSITLLQPEASGSDLVYQAAYQDGSDFRSARLTLRQGVDGRWKVLLAPAAISVPALPAAVKVAVDGTPITGVAAGKPGSVSVLPGLHLVKETGIAPFGDRSLQVTADQPLPAQAKPDLAPALDPAAAAAARSFAATLITGCAATNSARPAGCPNQVDAPSGAPVSWSALGSPDDAAVTLDDAGGLLIRAHYQLVAAYPVHVPEDTKHVAVGGGFSVPATYTAGAWAAGARPTAAAFDAVRPAASDQALTAAVKDAFDACAGSKLLRPADCPQTLPSQGFVGSVQWKLTGDAIAAATISFDTQRSLFSVTGSYAMSVTYTDSGNAKAANVGGPYRADLFWNGTRPVLVAIARA